ncbi:MAG: dynamin family protein [Thiohalocapsa sp.]|jgi:GTPase SAR1 family protein|uniref:dynamin family protein n=1 Tax=Thiohalocapsa sp. TaxID=2497641 RepID=UPI0025DA8BE1|nr:dynamin family protein [Thiohalocapsa sp.]MCG6943684.1 dynamin family protein [Thiohalocapsa sp.]
MPSAAGPETVQKRLSDLESHLEQENPILLNAVQSFRALDRVAYDMALLPENRSFASQVPWWPLISVLGTFSAGKSTFINDFLGHNIQRTGNQAVDDRFTVIVYSPEERSRTLPGIALDSDPRFPFYQMSQQIERVTGGEGKRIDAYLQLKTCHTDQLKGKILIDSPGFDADAQRDTILSITDHMIGLSDLVLVMFDARHPEPGAMRDTLKHLVVETKNRADSNKFLFILNQIDTSSKEDNPEDVVAAWLRALGEVGLTTGRFYTIFSPAAAPIADPVRRERFEAKRDADLKEIYERMDQVEVERAYRIISALRKTATELADDTIPLLTRALRRWRSRTLWLDLVVLLAAAGGFLFWSISVGDWHGLSYQPAWLAWLDAQGITRGKQIGIGVVAVLAILLHLGVRRLAAAGARGWLKRQLKGKQLPGEPLAAFNANIKRWGQELMGRPAGYSSWSDGRIIEVLRDCENYVQSLNERFTNPRGLAD